MLADRWQQTVISPLKPSGILLNYDWITQQPSCRQRNFSCPPRRRFSNSKTPRNSKSSRRAWNHAPSSLGVHTCDLHAIQLLDHVFDTGHTDPNYNNRRRKTLVISIECLSPCDEHSFCKSMGTLSADEGYDLHLTDIGDGYAIDVGTEAQGRNYSNMRRSGRPLPDDIQKLNATLSEKWPRFPYRLDFDVSDLPSLLNMSMQSPLWNELGRTMPGLRLVHQRLPDLFLLRCQG